MRQRLRRAGVRGARWVALWVVIVLVVGWSGESFGAVRLASICRVKGQEENKLHGLGLVVGLRGTGDGKNFAPAINSLGSMLRLLGSPAATPLDIKNANNVALVMVSATVPASGARQGDKLDCFINSVGAAKSLRGGRLVLTPLLGPRVGDQTIYAMAEGQISLDDPEAPTSGRIIGGAVVEEDFLNAFARGEEVTLVLDAYHASFQTASEVARLINNEQQVQAGGDVARALDAKNIQVRIPRAYQNDPVDFLAQVLDITINHPQTEARVVINEKAGTIVIHGDVEIGAALVAHKNLQVTIGQAGGGTLAKIEQGDPASARLKDLVGALKVLNVPPADLIAIVKELDRSGQLHAVVVTE